MVGFGWGSNKMKGNPLTELSFCLEPGLPHPGGAWQYEVEAALLLALRGGCRHVYGFDFTPPPFRKKLLQVLRSHDEQYKENAAIQFSITSIAAASEILRVVNWTDTLPFVLDKRKFDQIETPLMRRRWFIKAPFAWLEENTHKFDIVCYVSTGPPCLGIDIKTTTLGFPSLWNLLEPACSKYGVRVRHSHLEAAITEEGLPR